MTLLLTQISKYLITLVMGIYTAECFMILYRNGTERAIRGICIRQTIFLFALQALLFTQIIAHTGNLRYLLFYLIQLVVLVLTPVLFTRFFPDCSRPIINNMCMLLMIGMTIILRISTEKAVRQMIFVTVSIAIGMTMIWLLRRITFPRQLWWLYACVGIGALLVVLLLGVAVYGSRINYTILGFTFQPSEFVKILFVLFLAGALYQSQTLGRILLTGLIAAAHVMILVLSKDLGSALIFFVVYVCMIFIATGHPGWLIAGILLGVLASVAAYYLFGHVRARVLIFLDPWSTIDSSGYQIAQSLFSISAGTWLGRGLFLGMPTSIPFVEDDVVFSAIAEELGLVFSMLLLMVCLSTFLLFLQEAMQTEDFWCSLLAGGIAVTYLFQVFLTVGGGSKFIPLTGVTLPLVSYGGSSVLSTILMFCLFEGVSRQPVSQRRVIRPHALLSVGVLFAVLFVSMTSYIGYYASANRRRMMQNSYNRKTELLEKEVVRGDILSSDGAVLAYTEEGAGGERTRVYPYGEVFSHAVGYAVKDRAGVESYATYDLLQTGLSLRDRIAFEKEGKLFPGNNVKTTLHAQLQIAAYEALGNRKGAVIVSDPKTGKILAMVSGPSYDPGTIDTAWEALTADREDGILVNRATQGLYPAGSTFKIITTLAYLRAHPSDYTAYEYNCYGSFTSAGETVHCYGGMAHGHLDLRQAFAISCNSAFVSLGLETDADTLADTLDRMYFNTALPCDLHTRPSRTADPKAAGIPERMQLAIGQGETVMSPLHLNMITSAVANGGILAQPYLIDSITDVYGNVISETKAKNAGRLMSEEEAEITTSLMREVVVSGTGAALSGRTYEAAGKTGSAESKEGDIMVTHAWFTGFAPASDPEICVTIIVEGAGSSSTVAVPIAGILFDTWFANR